MLESNEESGDINQKPRSDKMVSNNNVTWKVIVGGQGGVGKTTFLHRYLTDQFLGSTAMTVGVQLHTHSVERLGKKIGLILWDLGGQERFRPVQGAYIRGAVAAIMAFDMSRHMATLGQLKEWIKMVRTHASPNIPILLIGTKQDLLDDEDKAMVDEEANAFIKKMDLYKYIPTSSKSGRNVEESVLSLIDVLLLQKLNLSTSARALSLDG